MNNKPKLKEQNNQRGVVMVTCLFFLLIVMTLGTFAIKDISLSEKSAGNIMDKQRSMHAAESAIRYAEWWLSLNNHGELSPCSDIVDGNIISNMRVCESAISDPIALPWRGYISYTPEGMNIDDDGGLANNGDINYSAPPILHIHKERDDRVGKYYKLTAAGFGGQASTKTIIQSTYFFSVNSIDLGGL